MRAAQSLSASAEIAETVGKPNLAAEWRNLARGAVAMEAAGLPGLYDHWAREAAAKATDLTQTQRERGAAT